MAVKRTDPTRAALDAIRDLAANPNAADLAPYLKSKSNHVISAAAQLAQRAHLIPLVEPMLAAVARLQADPAKLDKTNTALNALFEALYQLDHADPEPYLWGIHHVQMEASFGPPVDVGSRVRAQSALGLVRSRHARSLPLVTDLLVDKEPQARIGAAQALALAELPGAMVLRLKIRVGDDEADVLAECYTGLLEHHYSDSLELIQDRITQGDEQAMLALGTTRKPEALAILQAEVQRQIAARGALMMAIAMVRTPEARQYLEGAVRTEGPLAAPAREALHLLDPRGAAR